MQPTADFSGQRLLVVEDEWTTATEIELALRRNGAAVVGPIRTVEDALQVIDSENGLDGAILDLNLEGEVAYAVADELLNRRIPVLLATGYGENVIPAKYRELPRCSKPFDPADIVRYWKAIKRDQSPERALEPRDNGLLAGLSEKDLRVVLPYVDPVDLPKRTILDVAACYFLTAGVASCKFINRSRQSVEVSLIGPEGVTGLYEDSLKPTSRVRFMMVTSGAALRIDADALSRLACTEREIHRQLQRFSRLHFDEVAANLLATSRYSVRQRVARRILLVTDKAKVSQLAVSHEDIAEALGSRRAGVTSAIQYLTESGCIRHSRRHIGLIDRDALIKASGGCYP